MQRLRLSDYRLVLDDLLDKRLADLLLSEAGHYYQGRLDKQRKAIIGLPSHGDDNPFAPELEDADDLHDRWGRVIHLTTEVCRARPTASDELRAWGERVRQAFIPSLTELNDSYATEAERAKSRKPLLAAMKTELESVAVSGGGTLLDAATAFLAAGEKLDELLSKRGEALAHSRGEAPRLRTATQALLNKLRDELREEVVNRPELPRNLVALVFGYHDMLLDMRQRGETGTPPPPNTPPSNAPPQPS